MHEVSLVRSLIQQVLTVVADNGGGTVTEVEVSIGPLSGVEPVLVRNAFDRLAATNLLAGAELSIDCTPLTARCRDCGESFVVESFRFECSACKSRSVQITSGDEFRLLRVSVQDAPASELNEVSAK